MALMDSGFSARKLFFHGLPESKQIEGAPTASEALVQAGLDWKVNTKPMQYLDDDGYSINVPGRFVTVRSDNGTPFAPVGKNYTVLQNSEAFNFADALLGYGVEYEAAGSWNKGANVFLTAKLPEGIKVQGEEDLDLYLLFRNTHDGSGSVSAMITPLRINCTNQLSIAIRQAVSSWKHRHTSGITKKIDEATSMLNLVDAYKVEFEAITTQLQSNAMSVDEFKGFTSELTQSERLQKGMQENWLTSDTHARTNRWDALNSVTEFVEHQRGGRGSPESRFESNLYGQGATLRNRAVRLLTVR